MRPDLTPTSVSGPVSATKGRYINAWTTVRNQGKGNAGKFAVTFYLTVDGEVTATDIRLGNKSVGALPAGRYTTVGGSFLIPAATATGVYSIGVIADSAGTVAEADESNNAKAGNKISIK